MIFRAKAPLRIGLAGGGTDVSPYCNRYGGAVLNASVSLYAQASIEPILGDEVQFHATDLGVKEQHPLQESLPTDGRLNLAAGVFNRITKDFGPVPQAFRLTTSVDAPAGSGLGTSSTLVVAIVGAFTEWLRLPLGEYEIANLAYEIEREDLKLAGGRQDQYAATFGGVNFMEFFDQGRVIVNPLRIKPEYLNELEHNLLLYFTATSRKSADIIAVQSKNVIDNNQGSIEAMHQLKRQSSIMKEVLLKGNIDEIGPVLDFGFQHKKAMAPGISNDRIDQIYTKALAAGATGGKISGAGGGGFMMFYCPLNTCYAVRAALEEFGGTPKDFQFVQHGLLTWTI